MASQVGVSELHYAILTKDDETGTTYSAPVRIAPAIEIKIDPKVSTTTQYGDNKALETVMSQGEIDIELNTTELPLEVEAALLGKEIINGILVDVDGQPPYVAIGFKSDKSNGKNRFFWLYKGKFSPVSEQYKTGEDKKDFQTPTIKGSFVARAYDGVYRIKGDEEVTGFTAGATWFDTVVAPPTVIA